MAAPAWMVSQVAPWLIPEETPGQAFRQGAQIGSQIVANQIRAEAVRQEGQLAALKMDEFFHQRQDEINNRAAITKLTEYYATAEGTDQLNDPKWRSGLYQIASQYPSVAQTPFWKDMENRLDTNSKLTVQAQHWQSVADTAAANLGLKNIQLDIARQRNDLLAAKAEMGTPAMQNTQARRNLLDQADAAAKSGDLDMAKKFQEDASLLVSMTQRTPSDEERVRTEIEKRLDDEIASGSLTPEDRATRRVELEKEFGPKGQIIAQPSGKLDQQIRTQRARVAKAKAKAGKGWEKDPDYLGEKAALDELMQSTGQAPATAGSDSLLQEFQSWKAKKK